MAYINALVREVICKIVYAGPGFSGKTANLKALYARSNPNMRGELISPTSGAQTFLYEMLPISLGDIEGMQVYCHLYAVSGQSAYALGRRLVLRGVDGVVFVADSTPERRDANRVAMEELEEHLHYHGFQSGELPWITQYNKRDVASALPIEQLRDDLHATLGHDVEAIVEQGQGVFETMRLAVRGVMARLRTTEMTSINPRKFDDLKAER